MGLRFRKSFRVVPGFRINLGLRGVSATLGVPGLNANIGRQGVRGTVGLPGTGLSYSKKLGTPGNFSKNNQTGPAQRPTSNNASSGPAPSAVRAISSQSVDLISSPSLIAVRDALMLAKAQQKEIKEEFARSQSSQRKIQRTIKILNVPPLRSMFSKRLGAARLSLQDELEQQAELNAWMQKSVVQMDFDVPSAVHAAYNGLADAFEEFARSVVVWDVVSEASINQRSERSFAKQSVNRIAVKPGLGYSECLATPGRALVLPNANGEDILLYPGFIAMERSDGVFAMIDYNDLIIAFDPIHFVEAEAVPGDSAVVGQTWFKCNKDGSPDRRFADNYQIPVVQYGSLRLSTPSGLNEEYMGSNFDAMSHFYRALQGLKAALRS